MDMAKCRYEISNEHSFEVHSQGEMGPEIERKSHLAYQVARFEAVAMGFPVQYRQVVVEFYYHGRLDGSSGTLATAVGLLALFTGVKISPRFAITGSLDVFGFVYEVGGILDKVQAAIDGLYEAVIVPDSNYSMIPDSMKTKIQVHPVWHVQEALKIVTENKK
nr:hypothetical protein F43E2.10 - Caenorhabditis elegans [Caenorhabditis elegans]